MPVISMILPYSGWKIGGRRIATGRRKAGIDPPNVGETVNQTKYQSLALPVGESNWLTEKKAGTANGHGPFD